MNCILCSNMNATGGHHPKQINAGTDKPNAKCSEKWEQNVEYTWT